VAWSCHGLLVAVLSVKPAQPAGLHVAVCMCVWLCVRLAVAPDFQDPGMLVRPAGTTGRFSCGHLSCTCSSDVGASSKSVA
jgi:hypothetical protein